MYVILGNKVVFISKYFVMLTEHLKIFLRDWLLKSTDMPDRNYINH